LNEEWLRKAGHPLPSAGGTAGWLRRPGETAAPQGHFFLKRLKRGLSFALKLLLPGALKWMKFIL